MKCICDTCVLIDYLRGNEKVRELIGDYRADGFAMSAVTFMELMVGARNKREASLIKKTFADFEIIEINESISAKATCLIEQFAKSHGLLIHDALIAATSLDTDIPLFTFNVADFRFIPKIQLLES